MALKRYPPSIYPDPSQTVACLLLTAKGVTSGAAVKALPAYLKTEIVELAQQRGMPGNDLAEAIYWVIHDLRDYPKRCVECGSPVQFRSYAEAYMYDRCSTRCSNSSSTVKDKKEQASLDAYGVRHYQASEVVKDKIKLTNLERYGVESNMQRPDVFKKNMRSQFRLKPFTLPSGRTVELMGYEPQAITWLLRNGYEEAEIELVNVPSIRYAFAGSEHLYAPDAYLPKKNALVEVKSTWTLKADLDKNLAKAAGAVGSGYNYWLLVFDESGNLLEDSFQHAKV